jgi:putative DNA primase/helicase
MTDYFKSVGAQLLAGGYLIIPIRPGEKSPALNAWQRARLTSADLRDYPNHGLGILCGQGAHPIVGVDIDVSHPTIGPAIVAWCRQHLGWAPERVGAAPRILLVYRATEAGWAKGNSVAFFDPDDPVKPNGKRNEQRIEILGAGQQFVAYHIHPDTQRPYEWTDLFGGIEYMAAAELPVISEQQVEALMMEFARLVSEAEGIGGVQVSDAPTSLPLSRSEDDALLGITLKVGVPMEQAREALGWLDNTEQPYDTWVNVGMALHHEYDGSDAALALWQDWGSRSGKYQPGEDVRKWRSFGKGSRQISLRWMLKICNQAKADSEARQRREAMETIRARIRGAGDQFELTEAVARDIKVALPESPALRAEVLGLFQQKFKDITGTNLPVADARRMLVDVSRSHTVRQKRPLTEFGNAERMIDKYGQGMRYVPEMDAWYLWTGTHWRAASHVAIEALAKETVRGLVSESDNHGDEAGEFFAFCAISQQARMVRNMVQLAASDPRIMLPADELDRHAHLLGVRNGMVDLNTGTLLPADPQAYITRVCTCEFNANARAPLFERTVREAFFDDSEMVEYLYRCLGYALQGKPTEDILFMPIGIGSNGKSTVFNAVRNMLGGYARSAEASSFISDAKAGGNAGGPREDLLRLKGARFVYVNEPDENGELREGAVKSMTGGDAVTARGIHAKHSVEILPTWVIFMPTNHKPIIKGSDNGIWRRIGMLPFDRNFETDTAIPKDPGRRDAVMRESEGILAMLVRAGISYKNAGLNPPQKVRNARDAYRSQMDLLSEWLEECCDVGPGLSESSSALWQSWEQFAKNRGILGYVKSSVSLGRRLDSRFPAEKGSRGVRMRSNISLKALFKSTSEAGAAGQDLF